MKIVLNTIILLLIIPLLSFGNEVVKSIIFKGNQVFDDEYLYKIVGTNVSKELDEYQLFKKDRDNIINLYRANGYLDVKVGIDFTSQYDVIFQISEGKRTFIRSLKLIGNSIVPTTTLLELVTVKNGTPLNLTEITKTENAIIEFYASKGYIYADIVRKVQIKDNLADITLNIIEGNIVRVGKISIIGLREVLVYVVAREMYLKAGDIFIPEMLNKSRQSIYATGLFKSVYIELKGIEEKKEVIDLILHVEEDKLRWFGFGLGYGSVDGARFSSEWGYNNVFRNAEKIWVKSLISYNLQKNVKLEVDKLYSSRYEIGYFVPWAFGTRFSTDTKIFHQRDVYTKHEEEKNNGSLRISKKITDKMEASLQGRYEVTNIYRVADDASDELKKDAGKDYINSLVFSFQYDTRNSFLKPHWGHWIIITNETAGGIFGGSVDFNKTVVDIRDFRSHTGFFTLALHAKVGYAFPFGKTLTVPRTERFFVGGPTTVRGYQTDHLGITTINENNEEEPVGGRTLALFNVEIWTKSWKNFYLATFADGGYVWSYLKDVNLYEIESSFGVGLRYTTPVGPIRLDFAYPAKFNTQFRDISVHIGLGNIF